MKKQMHPCHEEVYNQFWEKVKVKNQIGIEGSGIGIEEVYGHVK